MTRRYFMMSSTAATASQAVRDVASPNDTVRVAVIGCGGRGNSHMGAWTTLPNVALGALVDVDDSHSERFIGSLQKRGKSPVKTYRDIRKVLDDKDIDAVSIASPNHWHALQTIWACQAGKDVYVEKPATHNVFESRQIVAAARKYNRIVQMGSQSRSSEALQEAVQKMKDGEFGEIYHARALCFKARNTIGKTPVEAVPPGVDYDMWCGPAPLRPFKKGVYHPGSLKYLNWLDLSNGMLAGMGSHTFSLPVRALKLGEPTRVEADITEPIKETYISAGRFRYEFAARGNLAPVTLWWTDGNKYPPEHVTQNLRAMNVEVPKHGCLFLGEKGEIYADGWGTHCVMKLKGDKHWRGVLDHEAAKAVPVTLPRVEGDNHMIEWLRACEGGPATFTNLEIGAHCCQVFLPGMLSLRLGRPIEWDAANLKVPGVPEADPVIQKNYRMKWMMA